MRVGTVTVSDTRTPETDESGRLLGELLRAAGFRVERQEIVRDDPDPLRTLVREWVRSGEVEAIVATGGTGIAARDQSIEAIEPIFDKKLDGFGEAFRRLSWSEVGPRAILSRAIAGVVKNVVVFVLPGSTKAIRLATQELIVPTLPHMVDLVQGRTAHPPKAAR